ncbi:MAG: helix-hairpin-helix domain-containing protein [Pseudomonadota bacterium]
MTPLSDVKGVGPAMERALRDRGIESAEDLVIAADADLLSLRGLGPHRVKTIRAAAETLLAAEPKATGSSPEPRATEDKQSAPKSAAPKEAPARTAKIVQLVPLSTPVEKPAKKKKKKLTVSETKAIKARKKAQKAVKEFEAELKKAKAKLAISEAKLAKAEGRKSLKQKEKKG